MADGWPDAELSIQLDKFTPTGEEDDPMARMLASVMVKIETATSHGWMVGMLHLELLAVTRDEDGMLTAVIYPENLEACHEISSPDGEFQTVTLNGREYVLYATPYQD